VLNLSAERVAVDGMSGKARVVQSSVVSALHEAATDHDVSGETDKNPTAPREHGP